MLSSPEFYHPKDRERMGEILEGKLEWGVV